MPPDTEPDRPSPGDVARRALAGVAATAIGAALAPAIGADGGAMAAGGLVPLFEQIASYDKLAAANAARTAELGAEFAGTTPEGLATWAESSPRRLALLANVVEAAWRLAEEEKTIALARLLADGVQDDARIDIDRLFVAALREFETTHVRVLRHMAHGGNPHDQPSGRSEGAPAEWATEHVRAAMPLFAEGMDYLLATLDRSGCIAKGASRYGGDSLWAVTPFGNGLLKFLVDTAVPDSPGSPA